MTTKLTLADAIAAKTRAHETFARLLEQSAFDVSLYMPDGHDPQTPHMRDELYVVVNGSGNFVCGGQTDAFRPGDVLFVPAGVEHRFLDFTPDFLAWAIFIGPRPSN